MAITETAISRVELDGRQAEEQLKELKKQAASLRKEMNELRLARDPNFAVKKREFDELQKKIDGMKKSTFDVSKVLSNLNGASLNDLTRAQRTLEIAIKKTERSTHEGNMAFKEKSAQLTKVKTEIARVKAEMGGYIQQQSLFSRVTSGFNQYFTLFATLTASIIGIVHSFRKLIDTYNEFEESVANLSALTGLSGEQLDWMAERAKQASISATEDGVRFTNSANDIVNAYTLIGSKRPELLKNREALASVTEKAMILSKAAKIELGPAAAALTTVMNQFNAPAEEARNIINALGAGSKIGAANIPYLNSAIEKTGTSAKGAGLSIEQLVGIIEGVAPKFSEPSEAGTSLRNVLLRLQASADDTNPAIVGLEKALDNLASKQYTTAELTKLFGLRAINMADALIESRPQIKEYTAAVTGSNIAVEQAIINSDTNITKLGQARNKYKLLAMDLGEKLAPALTFSTNSFSYLMKAIKASIDFFNQNKNVILGTITALSFYVVTVNAATIAKNLFSAATWLATRAVAAFNLVMKVNPYVAVASALAGLLVYLARKRSELESLTIKQRTYNEVAAETNKMTAEELATADRLFKALQNTNISSARRKELIDEINTRYKDYLPNLLSEKSTIEDIKTAYDNLAVSVRNNIELSVKKNKAEKAFSVIEELKAEYDRVKNLSGQEYAKEIRVIEGVRGIARARRLEDLKTEMNEHRAVYVVNCF